MPETFDDFLAAFACFVALSCFLVGLGALVAYATRDE